MRTRRSLTTAAVLVIALATTLPAGARSATPAPRDERPSLITIVKRAIDRVVHVFGGTPTVPIPEAPQADPAPTTT
jgi:hypothetical protein